MRQWEYVCDVIQSSQVNQIGDDITKKSYSFDDVMKIVLVHRGMMMFKINNMFKEELM